MLSIQRFFWLWINVFLLINLLACSTHVQTTSGRDYLSRYPNQTALQQDKTMRDIDQQVAEVAAVEPLLKFPARIGLAKVEGEDLAALSQAEADLWFTAVERLGGEFGEFVPVSRLIAEMVYPSQKSAYNKRRLSNVIRKIRLAAARQHLDAVLLYEVYGKSSRRSNPFALLDLTIVGAYLSPGQSLKAEGYAKALLLDVRNGYPYGTAEGVATKEGISIRAGAHGRQADLYQRTVLEATDKLVQETEKLFLMLRERL